MGWEMIFWADHLRAPDTKLLEGLLCRGQRIVWDTGHLVFIDVMVVRVAIVVVLMKTHGFRFKSLQVVHRREAIAGYLRTSKVRAPTLAQFQIQVLRIKPRTQ